MTPSMRLPPGGPYSHGIEAAGLYYTAGCSPHHPHTGEIPEGVVDQTHQVMANLKAILGARGLGFNDVLKATVHLANLEDFEVFNTVYASYFTKPYPVRTTGARICSDST